MGTKNISQCSQSERSCTENLFREHFAGVVYREHIWTGPHTTQWTLNSTLLLNGLCRCIYTKLGWNTSIAIHSNSIAGYVIMFTIRLLYSKPIVNGSRYWIWMNSYWNVRKSARWKGSSFCDFEIGLVVIWRHLSHFWHIRFLCFLTWVMRRTVANINPKIIHFDAVDFSGHHSKKL